MTGPADGAADRAFLRRAVRLAVRGHGGAEPNPLVGCVLVDARGAVVGEGFHARCGGPHAERIALAAAGERARGATAYVSLEPCNHHGRTPPCVDGLLEAGVARVVYATPDPNPIAGGGAARLLAAGVAVERLRIAEADELNAPFLKRIATGLPWVIAKWAQSVDGRIATRSGDSRWISSPRSRRMVHRERGRVDAILTGVGTALADDPELTARGVRRRRTALRVLVDPQRAVPADRAIFRVESAPTAVAALPARLHPPLPPGVESLALGPDGELRPMLAALARERNVATVLVEAGGGLLGRLLAEDLLDEAWIFVAPLLVADGDAVPALRGSAPERIADIARWRLLSVRTRGPDALLHLRKAALPSA